MNRILYKGIPFLVTIVISGSSVSTRSIVDGFDPVCCTDYCASNLVFISVQGMQSWDFAISRFSVAWNCWGCVEGSFRSRARFKMTSRSANF
ncbi:hypothetical protein B0T12DRAFT_160748 [Alternaria alternata]|nr:hypothetical protein B0T12DRAFT_160748 [Alternaria alternata]